MPDRPGRRRLASPHARPSERVHQLARAREPEARSSSATSSRRPPPGPCTTSSAIGDFDPAARRLRARARRLRVALVPRRFRAQPPARHRLMFRGGAGRGARRRFFAAHAQSCLGSGLAVRRAAAARLRPLRHRLGRRRRPAPRPAPGDRARAAARRARRPHRLAHVRRRRRRPALPRVPRASDRGLDCRLMIAGAAVAGVGTALFGPAALAGLPQPGRGRARARRRDGPLRRDRRPRPHRSDPRSPRCCWRSCSADDADRPQRRLLRGLGRADRDPSAGPQRPRPSPRATHRRCSPTRAPACASSPAARRSARCSAPPPAVVLCIGITNVGEVVLAREVLGVGGSGLAAMVDRRRPRHRPRLALHAASHRRRLGVAPRLPASASAAMAVDLLVCAFAALASGSSLAALRARRLRQRPRARPRPPAARRAAPPNPARPPVRAAEDVHLVRLRALVPAQRAP